jgi:hypothetical protein
MNSNNSKPKSFKTSLLGLACLATFAGTAPNAQAENLGQCLKDTASCGVKIAQTQIDLLAAATDVIAFAGANPHCISDIASSNFVTIGISSAMVGLAASGVIKQEGGSYINYIYGQGGRPIVQAVSSIIPVPAISNLLQTESDALIGAAFKGITGSIPVPSVGAPTLERQLDCGNAIAVAGQGMVGKVKTFVGHAKGAVKSCSAAASCFAGVLVDIVKDPVGAIGSAGEFLVDGADTVLDAVFGGCKNLDSQVFFDANIKPWTNPIAYDVIWGGNPNAYNAKALPLIQNCVGYYKGCDSDSKDANRRCTVMSTGAKQEDGNGWIEGKGLEQLVRKRQMELRIPQFLATDMKWALAQPSGGKDTAILNQQFARLPAQLQPLVKAKFSFSFKSEREAAARKIMGFAPGYSGNGDFGGKDAKVVMADQSIGALMLAYVPTQGAENKSTNTKINDLYKQYIPNGNALLQQIDAAVGESMGKAMAEVVRQNGDAWNETFTGLQLQKMVKRLDDCKDAHKDAAKTCKQQISDAIVFTNTAMSGLGKAGNYAGIGALGAQHPAYLNYVKFIQDADGTVGKHVAHSALVMLGESPLVATGSAAAPPAPGAIISAAKTPPPASTGLAGLAQTPGQAIGGALASPPKPSAPAATFGMPAAPTMGAVAMNSNRNPALSTDRSAPAAGKAPVVAAPAAANIDKPAPEASKPPEPPKSITNLLPFDPAAYRNVREKQIEDEWMPKCAGQAQCLSKVNDITDKLLNAEIAALKSGTPVHTDKAAVTAFQNSLDPIFDPQFKDALPKTVMASSQPAGPLMASNPTPPPKPVVTLLPFDAAAYRTVRDKEIKAEWMPKCGGNAACLQRMNDIAEALLKREIAALSAGTPLHTDRVAVIAFQNSLDPIFDPQFRAVIPVVATAPASNGSGAMSNKKPDFSIKIK